MSNLDKDILEAGNIAIGIFMELDHQVAENGDVVFFIDGYLKGPNDLKYMLSWDWLMPCVKKLNDMFESGEIEHDMESSAIHDALEVSILKIDIATAHKYFVQLLQWHNNNQSKQKQ